MMRQAFMRAHLLRLGHNTILCLCVQLLLPHSA
jgi:hypothetical protein